MNRIRPALTLAAACLALLTLAPAFAQVAPTENNAIPRSRHCDRACLYKVLDQYLAALGRKDPWSVPWAQSVRNSENNVMLEVGDGLWITISRLGSYQLRIADPDSGQVAYFGNVEETGAVSPFVVRLKVENGRVSEAETLVRRKADDANYMADPVFIHKPVLEETLPVDARLPRARLISLADGYWDTLQLNDGKLFTHFAPDCDRYENGVRTTNNPAMAQTSFTMTLGCEEQFRLGNFRYDDRLRQRAYPLVDVERGIVLSRAFMDHAGRVGDYTLTDGRPMTSRYRRPHSYYMLELFKMNREGQIRQIEAVFMSVPYHTKSVWE